MADLTLREFVTRWSFIFIAVFGLIAFALYYPALNGKDSILLNDSRINTSFTELGESLDKYQEQANINQNISTFTIPTVGSESIQLESSVSTNRRDGDLSTSTFNIIKDVTGNVLGFSSSGGLSTIFLVLVSLFTTTLGLLIWRNIRTGN